MRSVHRHAIISAALCTSAATAAPLESGLPAGLSGHLRIEVTEGGPVARSLILELPVTSEPSGAVNLLAAEGLTEGQQAAWDHRNRTITENMISPEDMTRVWSEFAKACNPAPSSAACAAAKAEVAALEERTSEANARAEAQLAAGPAMDVDTDLCWDNGIIQARDRNPFGLVTKNLTSIFETLPPEQILLALPGEPLNRVFDEPFSCDAKFLSAEIEAQCLHIEVGDELWLVNTDKRTM